MIGEVLRRLVRGEVSLEEAERAIRALTAVEVVEGLVRLDVWREARRGVPEVILCEGKPTWLAAEAAIRMAESSGRAIVSRAGPEVAEEVKRRSPGLNVEYHELARMVVVRRPDHRPEVVGGRVGVMAAGTADIPVAEEARIMAQEMGCEVYTAYDVGVASLARLRDALRGMVERDVDVLVVAAGMEGALPSVVASLVDVPVIALPTSTGRGLGGSGIAALLAMLQSCSLGVAVVNIDGGVAAGVVAALIARRAARRGRGSSSSSAP